MKDYADIPEKDIAGIAEIEEIESLDDYLSAESVAEILFGKFAYPFEVTSVLLLTAIVGALVVSKKRLLDEDEEGEI